MQMWVEEGGGVSKKLQECMFLYGRELLLCRRTKEKGAFIFGFDMDIFSFHNASLSPSLLRSCDFLVKLHKMYFWKILLIRLFVFLYHCS